jgi:hypothetical protein
LTGIEGDGVFTAGIGVILIIIAALAHGKMGKPYSIPGALIAFLAICLVISKFITLGGAITDTTITTTLGSRLYISLFGSELAFLGGIIKVA